jgi:hypothetical protein
MDAAAALVAIVPNALGGATQAALFGHGGLFSSFRLSVSNGISAFVISPEKVRGDFPAHVTINAGGVHVIGPRHIANGFVISICHNDDTIRPG